MTYKEFGEDFDAAILKSNEKSSQTLELSIPNYPTKPPKSNKCLSEHQRPVPIYMYKLFVTMTLKQYPIIKLTINLINLIAHLENKKEEKKKREEESLS